MHNIAHTVHIWFTNPKRVNDPILSHMWKFFHIIAPPDEIPIRPFNVIIFIRPEKFTVYTKTLTSDSKPLQSIITLVEGYFSLKSAGMRSSTVVLDGHIGMVLNFKNINLIHEIIMQLTIVWDTP